MIELLIVVAILSIMAAGAGQLVVGTVRGQAEYTLRAEKQTEMALTFTAIAAEATVALECLVPNDSDNEADDRAGTEAAHPFALAFLAPPQEYPVEAVAASAPVTPRWVVYRVASGRLERLVLRDNAPRPETALPLPPDSVRATQVLASHVRAFEADLEPGPLLRLRLDLENEHYRRIFRVGGATRLALPRASTKTPPNWKPLAREVDG